MPRVLFIAHEATSVPGQVGARLTELGIPWDCHVTVPDASRPGDFEPFPDLESYDYVISLGSYWSVTDQEKIGAWIDLEFDLLRKAHNSDKPVLGICFGGQALAAALGGSVQKADVTEIGWHELTAASGAEIPISTGPWMEWHHDCFTIPPDAELLAETPDAPQLYRVGRSVGTQFHPEIDLAVATSWLAEADDEYLATYGVDTEALLREVGEREEANRKNCAELVDWFLSL